MKKSSWRRFGVSTLLAALVGACNSSSTSDSVAQTKSCSGFDNFLAPTCLSCIHANCESQEGSASTACQCACTDGGADCATSGTEDCMMAADAIQKCFTQACPSECN